MFWFSLAVVALLVVAACSYKIGVYRGRYLEQQERIETLEDLPCGIVFEVTCRPVRHPSRAVIQMVGTSGPPCWVEIPNKCIDLPPGQRILRLKTKDSSEFNLKCWAPADDEKVGFSVQYGYQTLPA